MGEVGEWCHVKVIKTANISVESIVFEITDINFGITDIHFEMADMNIETPAINYVHH